MGKKSYSWLTNAKLASAIKPFHTSEEDKQTDGQKYQEVPRLKPKAKL